MSVHTYLINAVAWITRSFKLWKLLALAGILFISCSELNYLIWKYGGLFNTATFLPKSPLPVQHIQLKNKLKTEKSSEMIAPRILCLISTAPQFHQSRAAHVAATWARHCTKAIFLTSQSDSDLPHSYVIPEASQYDDLWIKISKSFDMMHAENVMSNQNCDWVLKADDDSFVIIENLQKALQSLSADDLVAVGHKLVLWDTKEIYFNGGAGYVMSKAAVDRFVTRGLREKECERNVKLGTEEDVNVSLCLQHLDIRLLELRDQKGKRLFHIYPPHEEVDPREAIRWKHLYLKKLSLESYQFGAGELSHHPVSFHHVTAEMMYLLYYLIYAVNPESDFNILQDLKRDPAIN